MRLIAKAKPVRIRITSGGIEHNSLKTLQEHFVWSDVSKLLDGRLIKWLKRIDKADIADRLSEEIGQQVDIIKVYNILFRLDAPFDSREAVFAAACSDSKLKKTLAVELVNGLSVEELISYSNRYAELSIFSDRIIHISSSPSEVSKENLFLIGEYLYKEELYKEKGHKCILSAAEMGLQEAKDFIKKHFKTQEYVPKEELNAYEMELKKSLNDPRVISVINQSWRRGIHINIGSFNPAMEFERNLYLFSNKCLSIFLASKRDYSNISYIAGLHIGIPSKSDIFYYEEKFVLALFEKDRGYAKEQLKEIIDYPPAKEMLESKNHSINKYGHSYTMSDGWNNASSLGSFIKDLAKLRQL